MLEFLVSDEVRCFWWLVSDHMTGESHSPISDEQLQHTDRPTIQRLLGKHFQSKEVESAMMNILLKIVPTLSTSTATVLSYANSFPMLSVCVLD